MVKVKMCKHRKATRQSSWWWNYNCIGMKL